MKLTKLQHLLITTATFLLLITSTPTNADQNQTDNNYGFALDVQTPRWQEFTTSSDQITGINIYIARSGDPGNLILELFYQDTEIWNQSVPASTIGFSDWVNLTASIDVLPFETYRLQVSSDTISNSSSHRYFWRGHINSNYTLGYSDVHFSYPDFDYMFKINEKATPDTFDHIRDQAQVYHNYGFAFDASQSRWQSFFPLVNELSRIDLYVNKLGNPGSLLISIHDERGTEIWNRPYSSNALNTGTNWINTTLLQPLPVIAGNLYKIVLSASELSSSVDDRYFWRGHVSSNYSSGETDLNYSYPTFDFGFVTWGLTNNPIITEVSGPTEVDMGEVIDISAKVIGLDEISSVKVHYKLDGVWYNKVMNSLSADNYYSTEIYVSTTNEWNTTMVYYIEATSIAGGITISPEYTTLLIYNEVDWISPSLSSPGNQTISINDTEKVLIWQVSEQSPARYELFQNGSLIQDDSYNTSISLDLSYYSIGYYIFDLTVYDISNNSASDRIFVSIQLNNTIPEDNIEDPPTEEEPIEDPTKDPINDPIDDPIDDPVDEPTNTSDPADNSTSLPTLELPGFSTYITIFSIVGIMTVRRKVVR